MDARSEVLKILTQRRTNAQSVALTNKAKALSSNAYKTLDKRERELVFDVAKAKAHGQNTTAQEREIKAIQKQKADVLAQLGLTKKDLEPQYFCKKCRDTGLTGAGRCSCFIQLFNEIITKNTQFQTKFADFSEFNLTGQTETQQKNAIKLKSFFEKWIKQGNYPIVVLSGKTGVGKTFLAECALSELQKLNKTVCKLSAFSMVELFTSYHTTLDLSKTDYLNSMLKSDCLLIDDLGTEPIKRNITLEYLYLILNERLNSNKKTIITTNLNLEEILSRYGERIFSRIANKKTSKCFQMQGNDLRLN